MNAGERLLVVLAALGSGALAGRALRHRLQRRRVRPIEPTGLAPGLFIVTAPFCTRCSDLRRRLTCIDASPSEIDAATNGPFLSRLGIRTAPTLLAIGPDGTVIDSEDREFSEVRLRELGGKRESPRSDAP